MTRINLQHRFTFWLLLALSMTGCIDQEKVDLIVHNATIYTVDEAFTSAEAMAIRDGIIVEVGPENQILNKYQAPQKIDARRATILPGFIDAHCHFMGYGIEKSRINLIGCTSYEDMVTRIEAFSHSHSGEWLIGRGWDQYLWQDQSEPTNDGLNRVFPDHFVMMKRVDGHAMLVNDLLLELAHINCETEVPGGKVICRDGKPTGILLDEATQLIEALIPALTPQERTAALLRAERDCLAFGLTTVSDAGLSPESVQLIDSLHQRGALQIRVYAMFSASPEVWTSMPQLEMNTDRLRANAIKLYADGALGSRGAYLTMPYSDDSTTSGLLIADEDSIRRWAARCYETGFQLNVHAIGDGANRAALDAMGHVLGGTNDRRWRIEHAQVVHPEDRYKFGAFNIIPSVQPTHAASDMGWAPERLGPARIGWGYAYRDLLEQNGLLALGTDFPVESINPMLTLYAACERKPHHDPKETAYSPEQRLSREEAIRGVTIWAAVANFEDSLKGSIEAGKLADFVVLNQDIVHCSAETLLETVVLQTWINGKLVYEP